MPQVAPAKNRPIRHEVQQQAAAVCVTSPGSPGNSSGCSQFPMGGPGRVCLPTHSHLGQSGGEVTGFPMPENHSDCSWMAQHALVLGPSDHVQSGSPQPAQLAKPVDTALQSDPSQKSDKSKSPCMAPRATAIKEQGFSETVAAREIQPSISAKMKISLVSWIVSIETDPRVEGVSLPRTYLWSYTS